MPIAMSKHIVVVESPAKAKTIEKYLGKDYTVLASYGHVRDLPSKNGSVDPDNDFAMNYQVSAGSEKNIKAITAALKGADTLYLATDLDREGEAISWHVLEEVKTRLKKNADKLDVKRIAFTEITKTALQDAIKNPRDLAMPMINAQQARRALDYLVGFNLSPVLWRKVRTGLSAGRVQSVALRLICERENEIEAFNPEEYWSIDGAFQTPSGATITARLAQYNGEKVEKFTFTDEGGSAAAVKALEPCDWSLTEIQKKQTTRRPAAPFITSTLQQEASRKLGYSAKKTMTMAQRLYEAGYITYMRTDSVNLANEALAALRNTIETRYGKEYLPEKPNFYKSKSQNAQEAHEAIRPTDAARDAKGVDAEADAIKLYDLIWKRTIACQMNPAKIDQTALVITEPSKQHGFRATGSIITFPGFIKVYREGIDDQASDGLDENELPPVSQGDVMDLKELLPEQHFTEPPPRYNEATLVKTLEEYGIGRPSTYAAIISTLQDRGYARLEKRRFFPEDVGRIVNKFLTEHFAQYVDYDFTANLEEDLDAIARGEHDWKPTLRAFWQPFKELVDDKIESVKKSDVTSEKTGEKCSLCNEGEMIIRLGRYGRFRGCSNYPTCTHTEQLDGSPQAAKAEPKETGVSCPKCKSGAIVERTSRRGKIFYSCNTYPKCKYALWNPPEETPCPQCNFPVTSKKETKRYGVIHLCSECDWQDPPAKAKADGAKKPAAKKTAAKKAPAKKPAKKATAKSKTKVA